VIKVTGVLGHASLTLWFSNCPGSFEETCRLHLQGQGVYSQQQGWR